MVCEHVRNERLANDENIGAGGSQRLHNVAPLIRKHEIEHASYPGVEKVSGKDEAGAIRAFLSDLDEPVAD